MAFRLKLECHQMVTIWRVVSGFLCAGLATGWDQGLRIRNQLWLIWINPMPMDPLLQRRNPTTLHSKLNKKFYCSYPFPLLSLLFRSSSKTIAIPKYTGSPVLVLVLSWASQLRTKRQRRVGTCPPFEIPLESHWPAPPTTTRLLPDPASNQASAWLPPKWSVQSATSLTTLVWWAGIAQW